MAELIFKEMVREKGLEDKFSADSCAVSEEELGNPIYPPAQEILRAHGLNPEGKTARKIKREEAEEADLLICMDKSNMRMMHRNFGDDFVSKTHMLMEYAGEERNVADPWYTDNFRQAWDDIYKGCSCLLEKLLNE